MIKKLYRRTKVTFKNYFLLYNNRYYVKVKFIACNCSQTCEKYSLVEFEAL